MIESPLDVNKAIRSTRTATIFSGSACVSTLFIPSPRERERKRLEPEWEGEGEPNPNRKSEAEPEPRCLRLSSALASEAALLRCSRSSHN